MSSEMSHPSSWEVPVVVFLIWTIVLIISSIIMFACLRRETRKCQKRLSQKSSSETKDNLLRDISSLESIMLRLVNEELSVGVLGRIADSFHPQKEVSQSLNLRQEARLWFQNKVNELSSRGATDKEVRKEVLAAVRTGLTRHPLDLRGSRRSLMAAKIFLELEEGNTSKAWKEPMEDQQKMRPTWSHPRLTCPTSPCDWVTAAFLKFLNLMVSHPTIIPVFCVSLTFLTWMFDLLTDIIFINSLWTTNLPHNSDPLSPDLVHLTTFLYSPLLFLLLISCLLSSLVSGSLTRLGTRFRAALDLARPKKEVQGEEVMSPTCMLARYDFHLSLVTTGSLPQFCVQFSAVLLILSLLESMKISGADQETADEIKKAQENLPLTSLGFSGLASGLSLVVGQYSSLKIQHEHSLTLAQKGVYLLACLTNSLAMMTTCLLLSLLVLLPCYQFVGTYHIMILVVLGGLVLGVSFLVNLVMAMSGTDISTLNTDRVVTRKNPASPFQSTLLGSVSVTGKVFSLVTTSMFLPPSQLLVHPFTKFYTTSPRSPALHQTVTRHLVVYNILMISCSILLCVHTSLSSPMRQLIIVSNTTGVPCIFLAYFFLFRFYSCHDLWTSNGVHLVYLHDKNIEDDVEMANDVTEITDTNIKEDDEEYSNIDNLEPYSEQYPLDDESSLKEHQKVDSRHVADAKDLTETALKDSSEMDRMQLMKSRSQKIFRNQSRRLKASVGCGQTQPEIVKMGGVWVNVSN